MRIGTVRGIITKEDKIAVIKRIRENEGKIREYYVLPGGGVEENESFEIAMKREAKEELGVDINVKGTLYKFVNRGELNTFMLCEITNGNIGSGVGPEFTSEDYKKNGQYIPMLLTKEQIRDIDLVPNEIRDRILKDLKKAKTFKNLLKVNEIDQER